MVWKSISGYYSNVIAPFQKTGKEIAEELGMDPTSVSRYIKSLRKGRNNILPFWYEYRHNVIKDDKENRNAEVLRLWSDQQTHK